MHSSSFFVTFFVYIVAGCVINKFVRVKEGREIFPNVDFWTGLPGLVKVRVFLLLLYPPLPNGLT
jgi:hypothetical protein